jgi:MauM/NapG family ferredoxin protein
VSSEARDLRIRDAEAEDRARRDRQARDRQARARQARGRLLVWLRRSVQGAILLLFLALILATRGVDGAAPTSPIKLFFDLDPVILISTWLSTHTLAGLSLLALITLAVTVLLGRVFCGWVCPFGVLHNIVTWLRSRGRKWHPPVAEVFSGWQRAKYYLLFALLVMGILGANWIGIFDPMAMLYRSTTTSVLPALELAIEGGATAVYDSDPHVGPVRLTDFTEPVYGFLRDRLFSNQRQAFTGSGLIFLIFVSALTLNLWRPRFWCRYVCPLGGLLGLFARRTMLRLTRTSVECRDCGLCTLSCPAAAQPEKEGEWLPDECFGCWNCVAACNKGGLDFQFETPWRRPVASSVSLSKRATLRSLAAGIGGLVLLRLSPQARAMTYHPALVRPPGARGERDFLDRCIQCSQCMKVCPTNALHPTFLEAGVEGMWTPILIPRLGYCEFECNLCGQVCPTEAIEPLAIAVKKKVKIGLAAIDPSRCLPYAYDRECIVCEEHCPIPDKAITFIQKEIVARDGTRRLLKQPRVDVELCTGCGICETKCPFTDLAAIRVTSGNEDRHPDNQPILPGFA